jgi:hypothetical protein
MKGSKRTVSADWIVPLRQELSELRAAMERALGRQLPRPQAWTPPTVQPQPVQYAQQYPPQGWR